MSQTDDVIIEVLLPENPLEQDVLMFLLMVELCAIISLVGCLNGEG